MSNSMQNDYFSFMSDRRQHPSGKRAIKTAAPLAQPVNSADTIDFVEETSEIEVIESEASDTLIQKLRLRWSNGG